MSNAVSIRPLMDKFRADLDQFAPTLSPTLPTHIPVERFKRVLLTAVNRNTDLLQADRRSLFNACALAAADGLYPDGREGALVIFNTKAAGGWVKSVQWMPMVYGIIKKMRNSGELADIVAHVVYQRDTFKYTQGDDERIEHEPYLGLEDPGPVVAAYCIARLKDGTVHREVMRRADIDRVRNASRSKDRGPWVDWYEEMARKSVLRRGAKYLPMSTEVERVISRDDALYASEQAAPAIPSDAPPRPIYHHQPAAQLGGPADDAQPAPTDAEPVAAADPEPAFALITAEGETLTWDDPADIGSVAEAYEAARAIVAKRGADKLADWLRDNADLARDLVRQGLIAPEDIPLL